MASIGIIGVGKNGEAFARELLTRGHSILLLNRTAKRSYGVMEDLIDAYPHLRDNILTCEEYDDRLMSSDILFILIKGNYEYSDFKTKTDLRTKGFVKDGYLLNNVANKIKGYNGYVVVVSNPVDIVAKQIMLKACLSPNRVLAYGSNLDTWRGQNEIARRLNISLYPSNGNRDKLDILFIGEHGDKCFGIWSNAKFNGKLLTEMGADSNFTNDVEKYVRTRGVEVMLKKFDTINATIQPLPKFIDWLLGNDKNKIEAISIFDEKNQVFYGQPVAKSGKDFYSKMPANISPIEQEALEAAIMKIKSSDKFAESLFVNKQIRKILYLDDDIETLRTVKTLIGTMARMDSHFTQRNSTEVFIAQSTREAREKLNQFNIDVLITDQLLRGDPEVQFGLDFVTNEVLANHPFTVPIMLSGQASEEDLKRTIGKKFGGYIQKPLDITKLEHWKIIKNALSMHEEKIID